VTTVAKRPVILSQFKLSTTGSLANIVSAENQSSSIMLRNLIFYFIILTRLITRSALQP